MSTIEAPVQLIDELLRERRARGADLYDYQVGDRYVVAPMANFDHQGLSARILAALGPLVELEGLRYFPGGNLGRTSSDPAGRAWYVVPDGLVAPAPPPGTVAITAAVIAIEILSPSEDRAKKLADYRTVHNNVGLSLEEVWYVDPAAGTVAVFTNPLESDDSHIARPGDTSLRRWLAVVVGLLA